MLRFSYFVILTSFLLINSACEDSKTGNDTTPDFDRSAMLRNYADYVILPAYANLQTEVNTLKQKSDAFTNKPALPELIELQNAWVRTYSAWQAANGFNFGPAGEQGTRKGLIEEIGTFPASETKIDAAIAANDHSLNNFDRDARGFLALEYLLFGKNKASSEIVTAFQASSSRQAHLQAIMNHLKNQVDHVINSWGTYKTEFVSNKGTDVGSSTSQLYNEFVRSYESIKNFKVALPAGKRPGQTKSEPQLVEAFYSGRSLEMLQLHLQAIEAIYYGRGKNDLAGIGFKDYLDNVEGGKALIALTEAQLQKVKDALANVPTDLPFSKLIANGDPSVETLHTELQKLTRFFKSDMSSLLGIAITFSSGDGD